MHRQLIVALVAVCAACAPDDDASPTLIESPSSACREAAPNVFRTRFVGTGLAEHDGRAITVLTSIETVTGVSCVCMHRDVIADGAFNIDVANLTDDAVYPLLVAYIDVDGDEVCSAATDPAWHRYSVLASPDLHDVVELTADDLKIRAAPEGCDSLP